MFESSTDRYKRKNLIHVFQVLRVTYVRCVKFRNLLILQTSTGNQIHIASTGGVKLLPSLQLSSVLKIET